MIFRLGQARRVQLSAQRQEDGAASGDGSGAGGAAAPCGTLRSAGSDVAAAGHGSAGQPVGVSELQRPAGRHWRRRNGSSWPAVRRLAAAGSAPRLPPCDRCLAPVFPHQSEV